MKYWKTLAGRGNGIELSATYCLACITMRPILAALKLKG